MGTVKFFTGFISVLQWSLTMILYQIPQLFGRLFLLKILHAFPCNTALVLISFTENTTRPADVVLFTRNRCGAVYKELKWCCLQGIGILVRVTHRIRKIVFVEDIHKLRISTNK